MEVRGGCVDGRMGGRVWIYLRDESSCSGEGIIWRAALQAGATWEKHRPVLQCHFLPADEDDANRLGEKVILREQVKELFNEKYGQCPHPGGQFA